jgi:hypothetical protein
MSINLKEKKMGIKKLADVEAQAVSITFEDESIISAALSELDDNIVNQLALHGLGQKLGDSYAGGKEIRDAGGDVQQWAKDNVTRVWANLVAGDWTVRGEGGPRITQLAQAVAEVFGVTVEQAADKLGEMEKEQKAAVAKAPKVAAKLAEIKAAKAQEQAAAAQKAAEGAADLPSLF